MSDEVRLRSSRQPLAEHPASLDRPVVAEASDVPRWIEVLVRTVALVVVVPLRLLWELCAVTLRFLYRYLIGPVGRFIWRALSWLVYYVIWLPVSWLVYQLIWRPLRWLVYYVIWRPLRWLAVILLVMPLTWLVTMLAPAGRAVWRALWAASTYVIRGLLAVAMAIRPALAVLGRLCADAVRFAWRAAATLGRLVYRILLRPVGHAIRWIWRHTAVPVERAVRDLWRLSVVPVGRWVWRGVLAPAGRSVRDSVLEPIRVTTRGVLIALGLRR